MYLKKIEKGQWRPHQRPDKELHYTLMCILIFDFWYKTSCTLAFLFGSLLVCGERRRRRRHGRESNPISIELSSRPLPLNLFSSFPCCCLLLLHYTFYNMTKNQLWYVNNLNWMEKREACVRTYIRPMSQMLRLYSTTKCLQNSVIKVL